MIREFILEGSPDPDDEPQDEIMTLDEFIRACKANAYTDDDGHGYFMEGSKITRQLAIPSEVVHLTHFNALFTHVIWYNK